MKIPALFVFHEVLGEGNGDVCNRSQVEHKACNLFPFVAMMTW